MANSLEDFFNSKGIKKRTFELNSVQESEIQSIIETVFKPAFEELSSEFNSYANIDAQLHISKKSSDEILENIEYKISHIMQAKFCYRPKFSLEKDMLYVNGQFCIPNLYSDCIDFKDTGLKKVLAEIKIEDIKTDVISSFKKNVIIK